MESINNTQHFDSLGLATKTPDKKEKTDEDQFLQLMLAQMKNQDPFKPMENGQFLSQLAQFSTVSGINEMNESFQTIAGSLQSNQALQASSMVGRSVVVPAENSYLSASGMRGAVQVDELVESVIVRITDQSGQVIRQVDLGPQEPGQVDFLWDGKGADGQQYPPGVYGISADSRLGQRSEALQTFANTSVESVTIGKGGQGLTLNLTGIGSYGMSDVKQIL